jgi:tRNA(Ile)-lysidine synthase
MVMLRLFNKAGFSIAVAHCNFGLRGNDSDGDEHFVRIACAQIGVPFHCEKFNTNMFAESNALSIQLAARKLRYDYFERVRLEHGYTSIATAHNLNDSFETVLLNLTKGTGIRGIGGIPVISGNVIRPLLFASRDQISAYAHLENVRWREDSSNAQDDYQRNFVRHHVVPLLKQINPNLDHTSSRTLERINGAIEMNKVFLERFKAEAVTESGGLIRLNSEVLRSYPFAQVLLWEFAKEFGFNYTQCCEAIGTTHAGKRFYSSTHSLTVDRGALIITRFNRGEIPEVSIDANQAYASNGYDRLVVESQNDNAPIENSSLNAQVDASKLSFPLIWRKWRAGDTFQPLGMESHKKISDLLIDLKVPAPEKEHVTVIESAGKIVWVVGLRMSDLFKVSAQTTAIVKLAVEKLDPEKIS